LTAAQVTSRGPRGRSTIDLACRRQGDRRTVAQPWLAQGDQDQEVLGGVIERERRDRPVAAERDPGST